jgi:hypothetical protein
MTTERRNGESGLAWSLYRQFGVDPKGKCLKDDDTTKEKWPLNASPEAIDQIGGQAAETITSYGEKWLVPELQVRPEMQLVQQRAPSALRVGLSGQQCQL